MKITPEEVRHIARLARLELTADEVTRFQVELSQILDYVAQLEDIESGVSAEPTPPDQPLRQDVVEPCADPSSMVCSASRGSSSDPHRVCDRDLGERPEW
jgi:aspartyl-tRNA(Asn)/glutamyl-tRNA(Gln) amidotransferase subunit C